MKILSRWVKPLGQALLGSLLIQAYVCQAGLTQNITPANDGTNTTITINGNTFNIEGGTFSGDGANLFHSLQQFGLSADQIANFISLPDVQNILTRVVGGDVSVINGLIQVTGGNSNLFIMNPAGIVFGQDAALNVPGSFTATTATGISFGEGLWFNAVGSNNYQALVGTPSGFAFDLATPGNIINAGDLEVAAGHTLTLMGGTVINTGTLKASGGNVVISAVPGSSFIRISQPGQILSIEVDPPRDTQGQILPFQAVDIPTLLTTVQGVNTGLTANADGTVALTESGTVIPTDTGTNIVSGGVNVSNSLGVGGTITVTGDTVGVIDGSLNASGLLGGGDIRVGGDFQGNGVIPNATVTVVDEDSVMNADATNSGDGGRIIIWSDGEATFDGVITAKGGLLGGDGGFVETSGSQLTVTGDVDASSVLGNAGTWLIDPTNITIVANGGGNIGESSVNVSNINTTLGNGTNVEITTNIGGSEAGNITQESGAAISWGTDATFTLTADNDITLNASITSTGAGDITLNGSGAVQVNSNLSSNGGNIFITGITSTAARGVEINGGLTSNGGDISLSGTNNGSASEEEGLVTSGTIQSSGGDITLVGMGFSDDGVIAGGAIDSGGGDITITGTAVGNDFGIVTGSGNITSQGGNITLVGTGNADFTAADIGIFGTISSGAGNLTITANRSFLEGSLQGTGSLTLQPSTATQNIAIGVADNSNTSQLNLTTAEINNIQDGFSSITIGRNDGTGIINVVGDVSFNDPLTLQSPSTVGNVNIDSSLNTNNNPLTLNAGQDIAINSDISTGTGNVQFDADRSITLNSGSSITTTSGNVTLNANQEETATTGSFDGIYLNNATITSTSGDITLKGKAGDTAGEGILLRNGTPSISTGGEGNVTLIGDAFSNQAQQGAGVIEGIAIDGGEIQATGSGAITLTGVNMNANNSIGIYIGGNIGTGEGSGTVNIIGSSNSDRGVELGFSDSFSSQAGTIGNSSTSRDIIITSDQILLDSIGGSKIQGTGNLTLQPLTTSTSIGLGDNSTETFNLDSSELGTIQDGFNSITIGRSDGIGIITVANSITFNDSTQLRSPTVNLNAPISLSSGSTLSGTATTVNITNGETTNSTGLIDNGLDISASGGTINIGAGTYTQGEIFIDKSIIINGNSAEDTIISGNNVNRVFNIAGEEITVNLDGLTIRDGTADNASGGGILNTNSTLTIANSVIANNEATITTFSGQGRGGGINNDGGIVTIQNSIISDNNAATNGGGIRNHRGGTIIIQNTTISGNTASRFGGGIRSFNNNDGQNTVIITDSIFSNNTVTNRNGGGISNVGQSITIEDSTFSNNRATNGNGGAIHNGQNGTLNLTNLTLEQNTAVNGVGSGIFSQNSNEITFNGTTNIGSDIVTNGSQSYNGTVIVSNDSTLNSNGNDITFNDNVNSVESGLTIQGNNVTQNDDGESSFVIDGLLTIDATANIILDSENNDLTTITITNGNDVILTDKNNLNLENINTNNGVITLNVTIDISQSANTSITGSSLNITASTIGTSDNPLQTNVNSLTTTTTGNQFISESDNLNQINLNSGESNINLTAGTITDTDESTDIQGNEATLNATSLGTTNNPINTDINSLNTTTTGNQFITENDNLTQIDLNSGESNINLTAGTITDTDESTDIQGNEATLNAT
ncbi:MAG: beta strand repeat-containing protein, partial [Microcystaceae cyanobacterium]